MYGETCQNMKKIITSVMILFETNITKFELGRSDQVINFLAGRLKRVNFKLLCSM